MKRLGTCFALLMVMSWPLAAEAGAKKAPSASVQVTADLVGADLVSPAGNTGTPYMYFHANVLGADTASACILAPALPCKLVSYVDFWVDLPNNLINHPDPLAGCPSRATTTCQYMGRDYESAYGLGLRYDGPGGDHRATAVAWRSVWGDAQPVFLGQGSEGFSLTP